jgi:hypothetical protein
LDWRARGRSESVAQVEMERRYCEIDPLDPITPMNIGQQELQTGGRIDSIAGKVRNARGKSLQK